jgi:hypothetical protein
VRADEAFQEESATLSDKREVIEANESGNLEKALSIRTSWGKN